MTGNDGILLRVFISILVDDRAGKVEGILGVHDDYVLDETEMGVMSHGTFHGRKDGIWNSEIVQRISSGTGVIDVSITPRNAKTTDVRRILFDLILGDDGV